MKKSGMQCVVLAMMLSFVLVCAGQVFAGELDNEKLAVAFAREVERGGYKIVTTQELKEWVDAKKPMLLIDTMPYADSYKKNHIPGAVQMEFPIPEMTALDDKRKGDLLKLLGPDKDRLIVFYCGFTKCTRSHNGGMWAKKLGYTNVYRHPGGIVGWKDAGYPVASVK